MTRSVLKQSCFSDDSLASGLEAALDAAAYSRPQPGAPWLHRRQSRNEYANAVRDQKRTPNVNLSVRGVVYANRLSALPKLGPFAQCTPSTGAVVNGLNGW